MRARRCLAIPMLLSTACVVSGSTTEETSQTVAREVSLSNTTTTYNLGFTGYTPLPSLSPAHGSFSSTTVNGVTTAPGTYTNYQDLAAAPGSNESAWNAALPIATTGTYASDFVAPNFLTYMTNAASQANSDTIGAMNTNGTLN